jgi:hypothetical protein
MMSASLIRLFLSFAVLVGSIQSASALDGIYLPGRWYGDQYVAATQQRVQWITQRRADGTFTTELRLYDGCRQTAEHAFSGEWSFDGRIYTSRMLVLDGRMIDRIETYEFFELTERSMAYLHREGKTRYAAQKVDSGFQLPACPTS